MDDSVVVSPPILISVKVPEAKAAETKNPVDTVSDGKTLKQAQPALEKTQEEKKVAKAAADQAVEKKKVAKAAADEAVATACANSADAKVKTKEC